ncbi:uncharacterized protein [Oscarella lobularis]
MIQSTRQSRRRLGGNSGRNTRSRKKGGVIALGFGLVFLFCLTATPIFVYYFFTDDPCQLVPTSRLRNSVCSSVFPKWNTSNIGLTARISVSGCDNYSKAEEDLETLFNLIESVSHMWDEIKSPLCRYVFRDCKDHTGNQCQSFADFSELSIFEDILNKLKDNLTCFSVPKCTMSRCSKPMLPTNTSCAHEKGMCCSPPCDGSGTPTATKIYDSALYISSAIFFFSLAVLFFTLAKMKKTNYQFVTGLAFTVTLSMFCFAMFLHVVVKDRLFCKHKTFVDSFYDPTTLCHVQGICAPYKGALHLHNLIFFGGLSCHFGLLSFLCWWLMSVFNALLTVWKPTYLSQKRKAIVAVELTLTILIPGGVIAYAGGHGLIYTRTTPGAIACVPSDSTTFFYAYLLPVEVIILFGTVMSAVVMYKIYLAKKLTLDENCTERRIVEEYTLVQKRFFFLSLLLPLSLGSTMTTNMVYGEVYSKSAEAEKVIGPTGCLRGSDSPIKARQCMSKIVPLSGIILTFVEFFVSDLAIIAVVAYCLMPKEARACWSQMWKKIRKRVYARNNENDEIPSEVTRLFSSSTSTSSQLSSLT